MEKNKKMVIRIEGHVNDPLGTFNRESKQSLSESRANTVYEYLLGKGIKEERMSKIGFGDRHILYPQPKNEDEQEKNRRVEINVISIR